MEWPVCIAMCSLKVQAKFKKVPFWGKWLHWRNTHAASVHQKSLNRPPSFNLIKISSSYCQVPTVEKKTDRNATNNYYWEKTLEINLACYLPGPKSSRKCENNERCKSAGASRHTYEKVNKNTGNCLCTLKIMTMENNNTPKKLQAV